MKLVTLHKNGERQWAYFNEAEFYAENVTFSRNLNGKSHTLPLNLINAANFLREFYGVPLIVTSTLRPEEGQATHKEGIAVDLSTRAYPEVMRDFGARVKRWASGQEDHVIRTLRERYGLQGIGGNRFHIHIDARQNLVGGGVADKVGRWNYFDEESANFAWAKLESQWANKRIQDFWFEIKNENDQIFTDANGFQNPKKKVG